MNVTYRATIAKTLFILNLWKLGIADSTKEATMIDVKITNINSRKYQTRKKPSKTKQARIIVPVDIE